MRRTKIAVGLLGVFFLAGCAAKPPTAEEMGKVYYLWVQTVSSQGTSGIATDEPLYHAAQLCGMSRNACRAGREKMQSDRTYALAVMNAAVAVKQAGTMQVTPPPATVGAGQYQPSPTVSQPYVMPQYPAQQGGGYAAPGAPTVEAMGRVWAHLSADELQEIWSSSSPTRRAQAAVLRAAAVEGMSSELCMAGWQRMMTDPLTVRQ